MQHYLTLGRGNFYAEKQRSNKVTPFDAVGLVTMPRRVYHFVHCSYDVSATLQIVF